MEDASDINERKNLNYNLTPSLYANLYPNTEWCV